MHVNEELPKPEVISHLMTYNICTHFVLS